jgi:hypothetical protein
MPRRTRTKRERKQTERDGNTRFNELRHLAVVLRAEWRRQRINNHSR